MKKIIITDLDNTLYDWVAWFIPSFYAMAEEVAKIIGKDTMEVLSEYKALNQLYANVEPAYSTLDLPMVRQAFPDKNLMQRKKIFEPAFKKFRAIRGEKLKLYPTVLDTLKKIKERGIILIGCSDASLESCHKRLSLLNIEQYFTKLYVKMNIFYCPIKKPPKPTVPYAEINTRISKPNPQLLLNICKDFNVEPNEALFVGDSEKRDMGMANLAGVTSVWAKYGTELNKKYSEKLSFISIFSPAEIKRMEKILGDTPLKPDYIIKNYSQILDIFDKKNN